MVTQVTLGSGVVSSAGSLKLQTNGTTDAVTFDTAQNMGLGVTPSAWYSIRRALQFPNGSGIFGNTSFPYTSIFTNAYDNTSDVWTYVTTGEAATRYDQIAGQHRWFNAASGTAGNPITFTQAMTLDASGNLLVGNTTASSLAAAGRGLIESSGSTDAAITLKTANTINGYLYSDGSTMRVAAGGTAPLILWTNSSERARIDSSGNLLVGTTSTLNSNSHAFVASGTSTFSLRYSGATAGRFWKVGPDQSNNFVVFNQADVGMYMVYGQTSWAANSDERLKTTLTPFENATQKLCTLRAGTGRYLKDDESVSRAFLIAQDVQAVLPEAVDIQSDEQGTLGLRYQDLIPLLVASIQEQQAIIEQLKADVAALKA